jgi:hypothetical protein
LGDFFTNSSGTDIMILKQFSPKNWRKTGVFAQTTASFWKK